MDTKQPTAPSQPKLRYIMFDKAPDKVPGVRAGDVSKLDLFNPTAQLYGWQVRVRRNTIYMISPPGWDESNATEPRRRNEDGPCVIVEIPRANAYLRWEAAPDEILELMKSEKWDSGVLGPSKPVVEGEPILAQIPKHQLGD